MMLYQVDTVLRTAGDKQGAVVTLCGPGGSRAEVWTACGFNCLKWSVAEGKEAAIQKLQEQVRKGPLGARVDGIKTLTVDDAEKLKDFDIKESL